MVYGEMQIFASQILFLMQSIGVFCSATNTSDHACFDADLMYEERTGLSYGTLVGNSFEGDPLHTQDDLTGKPEDIYVLSIAYK